LLSSEYFISYKKGYANYWKPADRKYTNKELQVNPPQIELFSGHALKQSSIKRVKKRNFFEI
jgi:hypothetical protein